MELLQRDQRVMSTYIGNVCKRGHHPAVRYIATRACVECNKERGMAWSKAHPSTVRRSKKEAIIPLTHAKEAI